MRSPKYLCRVSAALLLAGLPLAHGETLVPLQGQTQQQIQADIAACQSQSQSSASSTSSSSGGAERLRGAAKGAVTDFCSGLRGRLHRSGVHLLTIKPGFVDTPMTQGLALPQLLLALVMAGAIALALLPFAWARRRSYSLLGAPLQLPVKRALDRRLLGGSLLFGIGWGIAGICPGPAVAILLSGHWQVLVFVAAMLAGMALFEVFERRAGG